MFAHALFGLIALIHGSIVALPQKAADAAAGAAATRPATPRPMPPTPAPAPTPPTPMPPTAKPPTPTPMPPVVAGPSAAQVVADVQKYYNATSKFEADFRQKYTNSVIGKSSVSNGKVYIEKPGKMRWDYKTPDIKYYISDGTTLWVYEKANKQAFKQNLQGQLLPVAITFLYGQGDLAKDFTASLDPGKYGAPTDRVVKLVPKAPTAQYKSLWLVVDPADGHVKESVIEEVSGNTNSFSFMGLKTNEKATYVGANLFKFVPPKGVKVITPPAGQPVATPGTTAPAGTP